MKTLLDAESRRRLAEIEAEKREITRPLKDAQRRERKAARKARSKVERAPGQRQERILVPGYLQMLRRMPCVIGWQCQGRTDPAHLRFTNREVGRINPGLGRKSHDFFANPLCRRHHDAQHKLGDESAWWSAWGLDPDELSARLYSAYQAGTDPLPIIEEARRKVAQAHG